MKSNPSILLFFPAIALSTGTAFAEATIPLSVFAVRTPRLAGSNLTPSPAILAALGLGGPELVVILLILLVLFGGTKLPGLAKGLGQSIKEFKKAAREDDEPAKPADTKSTDGS